MGDEIPLIEDLLHKLQVSKNNLELGALRLDKDQNENYMGLSSLFDANALQSVSKATYYRFLKVQKLLRKIDMQIGPVPLLLCMISWNVTDVQKIDLVKDFPQLQKWCSENPANDSLVKLAKSTHDKYDLTNRLHNTIAVPSSTILLHLSESFLVHFN